MLLQLRRVLRSNSVAPNGEGSCVEMLLKIESG